MARSRLSDIERGYAIPDPAELVRIVSAIEDLERARRKIMALAAKVGWPIKTVRLSAQTGSSGPKT
jgi:hypothetical protein